MDEERFDFENLKVYQKALEYVDFELRTPNSELKAKDDALPHKTLIR